MFNSKNKGRYSPQEEMKAKWSLQGDEILLNGWPCGRYVQNIHDKKWRISTDHAWFCRNARVRTLPKRKTFEESVAAWKQRRISDIVSFG